MGRIAICVLLLIQAVGCQPRKPLAIGGNDQIIVLSDSLEWNLCKDNLHDALERTYFTPQPESEFYLQRVSLSVFPIYEKYKFILMIARLGSDGEVSTMVNRMLTDSAKKGVQNGDYFVFTRRHEWAQDQLIMILVSDQLDRLNRFISDNSENLHEVLYTQQNHLVGSFLYEKEQSTETDSSTARLFEKYGWSMRLPAEYKLVDEKSDYVRFHSRAFQSVLQQWICVHWLPTKGSETAQTTITQDWMRAQRDTLGAKFFEPVTDDTSYSYFSHTKHSGHSLLTYQGVWKTLDAKNPLGGAFRSYAFFEPTTKRIFFIDLSVFFPGEDKKLRYFSELEAIANTFSVLRPN